MNQPVWVKVPKEYSGAGDQVDARQILSRRNRDIVFWFEIAALCEEVIRLREEK